MPVSADITPCFFSSKSLLTSAVITQALLASVATPSPRMPSRFPIPLVTLALVTVIVVNTAGAKVWLWCIESIQNFLIA